MRRRRRGLQRSIGHFLPKSAPGRCRRNSRALRRLATFALRALYGDTPGAGWRLVCLQAQLTRFCCCVALRCACRPGRLLFHARRPLQLLLQREDTAGQFHAASDSDLKQPTRPSSSPSLSGPASPNPLKHVRATLAESHTPNAVLQFVLQHTIATHDLTAPRSTVSDLRCLCTCSTVFAGHDP